LEITLRHHNPTHGIKQAGDASPAILGLFATAAGLSVANIYYAQPLLDAMAREFAIGPASIGLVVTLTQVGYALGLIFVVPLGDLIDRRRLIVGQTLLSAAALGLVAMAGTGTMLFIGLMTVGMLAVVVQVLVATVATLAGPHARGTAVGTVTSGVVIGILGARFVAGMLADLGGWRTIYMTSAIVMLAMATVLFRVLPAQIPKSSQDGYGAAVLSIPALFLGDKLLLVRGVLALLVFAAFSTFWTALVLPLSEGPFSYSYTQIGLFGLVGMAGALAASKAGRFTDQGHGQQVTGISLVILTASWGLIVLLPVSIPLLVVGVILLDLAVQAVHVTNQSLILVRHPQAGSRVVGGYMVFYSIGSATGAMGATLIYDRAGWTGVSVLGATFSFTALLVWACTERKNAARAE